MKEGADHFLREITACLSQKYSFKINFNKTVNKYHNLCFVLSLAWVIWRRDYLVSPKRFIISCFETIEFDFDEIHVCILQCLGIPGSRDPGTKL